VLPFQNILGDPEQEYFVDGLVEGIVTELSKFRELLVTARASSFAYKGRATEVKFRAFQAVRHVEPQQVTSKRCVFMQVKG
jgi:TolB-like protein